MLPPLEPSEIDPSQRVLPWSEMPYTTTWDDFEKAFVWSGHRRERYYAARARLERLEVDEWPLLAVWINGSFVTDAPEPQDIDLAVLIDGSELGRLREELGPAELLRRQHALERYEPGGTRRTHLTEFLHVVYYPPSSGLGPTSQAELDLWHQNWSRLRLRSPTPHEQGILVEDAKGFVEVRLS